MRVETLDNGHRRIHLDAPILNHDVPQRVITLRPPTFGETIDIGDPQTVIFTADRTGTMVTDRAMLRRWFRVLLVDHVAELVEAKGDIALALMVEEVILGFFTAARTRLTGLSEPSSPAA